MASRLRPYPRSRFSFEPKVWGGKVGALHLFPTSTAEKIDNERRLATSGPAPIVKYFYLEAEP
jgi:hypothetical protein